jgi:hypothetical protein
MRITSGDRDGTTVRLLCDNQVAMIFVAICRREAAINKKDEL